MGPGTSEQSRKRRTWGERRTPPEERRVPSPRGVPGEEPRGARLGTHVGADLGHPGAQVEHGGDGADGKSNDFSPGERLQGRAGARASPSAQSPGTATPTPPCPAALRQPADNYNG